MSEQVANPHLRLRPRQARVENPKAQPGLPEGLRSRFDQGQQAAGHRDAGIADGVIKL